MKNFVLFTAPVPLKRYCRLTICPLTSSFTLLNLRFQSGLKNEIIVLHPSHVPDVKEAQFRHWGAVREHDIVSSMTEAVNEIIHPYLQDNR